MLTNYGRLRKGEDYRVQAVGFDWVLVQGVYVHLDFVKDSHCTWIAVER